MAQMLPNEFLRAIAAPGQIESQVKAYFSAAKYAIDNDKTIAGTKYYHWQSVAGVNNLQYFTGVLVPAQTNVPANNFVRPQSEHQLIYGLRVESAVTVDPAENDWTPGCIDAWGKNCVFTITSNGVVMVKDIPMSEALENLTTSDNGLITFAVPWIWGGQEELVISVRNKDGVNGPTNTKYKLTLQAMGLVS